LDFEHLVIFEKDDTMFAAARQNDHRHLRIFLIYNTSGNVYTRNGRADSWEELFGSMRDAVVTRIIAARNYAQIPVYRINDNHPNN
jgi:hypothetical protein